MDLKPDDWSKDAHAIKAPMFIVLGDLDGVRYEHAIELFRAKGDGKNGDIHGLPKSRLAILPGTTHIGAMQRWSWLVPMIDDFLDSELTRRRPRFSIHLRWRRWRKWSRTSRAWNQRTVVDVMFPS